MRPPRFLLCVAAATGFSVAASHARAAEADPTAGEASPAGAPSRTEFVYTGRALYLSAGGGLVADLTQPTVDGRLLATFAVARWAMVEGFVVGDHFSATGPQKRETSAFGLGFGVGFRVATAPSSAFRPFLALRFEHMHLVPDPWGTPSPSAPDDPGSNGTIHRWGGVLAVGVDAPIAPRSRWRVGLELQGTALSGPAANAFVTGYLTLGVGL